MGRTLQLYKKLFEQLKTGSNHQVYFLHGPEEFMKKEFIGELIEARLSGQNRAFNLDIFHGDDFDRDSFNERISSFPLFNERRMVILKKTEALTTANKDFVLERLVGLSDTVIFVAETAQDRLDTARIKKFKQIADDKGLSFRFQHLSDDETIDRVKGRLHREGYTIHPDALEVLLDSVGTSLIDLANEIEKIMMSVESGTVIDRDLVGEVVGKYRTENLFAFLDQLGKKDTATLVRRMHRIVEGGEEPVFVLAMILRRVLQLLHITSLLAEKGVTPRDVTNRMAGRVSPYQLTQLIGQARAFDSDDLKIYLTNLRWADVKLKSTGLQGLSVLDTALVASIERKTLAL